MKTKFSEKWAFKRVLLVSIKVGMIYSALYAFSIIYAGAKPEVNWSAEISRGIFKTISLQWNSWINIIPHFCGMVLFIFSFFGILKILNQELELDISEKKTRLYADPVCETLGSSGLAIVLSFFGFVGGILQMFFLGFFLSMIFRIPGRLYASLVSAMVFTFFGGFILYASSESTFTITPVFFGTAFCLIWLIALIPSKFFKKIWRFLFGTNKVQALF